MMNTFSPFSNPPGAVKHPKGAVVRQAGGSSADEMLYLLEGNAVSYKENKQVIAYGPGSVIGELSFFLGQPVDAQVIAISDVTLLVINRSNIHEIYQSQPELTWRIMENMCQRIDALQNAAAKQTIPAKPTTRLTQEKPAVKLVPTRTSAAKPVPAAIVAPTNAKSAWDSPLFPEGHRECTLPFNNESEGVYEDDVSCPLCKHKFKTMKVIVSKLRQEGTDSDLRVRYKDVDPMYYDIVSCPNCLYSASENQFSYATHRIAQRVNIELEPFRSQTVVLPGLLRDSFTVIAGYYLAILCAPICIDSHEIVQARHWQKLGWIYGDSQDGVMSKNAFEHSLAAFRHAYDHFDYSPKQMQQMCFIMGDIYQKLGDYENARRYFYDAKANREGTAVMKRNADTRLEEIKGLLKD